MRLSIYSLQVPKCQPLTKGRRRFAREIGSEEKNPFATSEIHACRAAYKAVPSGKKKALCLTP